MSHVHWNNIWESIKHTSILSSVPLVEGNGFLGMLEVPFAHLFHLQNRIGSRQPYPLQISSVRQDSWIDLLQCFGVQRENWVWSFRAAVYLAYCVWNHISLSFWPTVHQLAEFSAQTSMHGSCICTLISVRNSRIYHWIMKLINRIIFQK